MEHSRISVTVLGSGTSHGVPMIGCQCTVCSSPNPKDKRTRPSLFVAMDQVRVLVDTAPEMRMQCIAHGVEQIDAVLYTHHHADHVVGLDDLRRYTWQKEGSLPCIGTRATLDRLQNMFSYAFFPSRDSLHSRPNLELRAITDAPFDVGGRQITPIELMHGPDLPVLGFRFGDFAYCTDCNHIPERSLARLRGLDVLILDALRKTPHPTHFNLEQAVAMAHEIGAKKTYFTHIAHELLHDATNAELPNGMELAYDGLSFSTS